MQPLKYLRNILEWVADAEHYLFAVGDLRQAVPDLSPSAFKSLLHRTAAAGVLDRLCRGLYLAPRVPYPKGLVLYHAAARLRAISTSLTKQPSTSRGARWSIVSLFDNLVQTALRADRELGVIERMQATLGDEREENQIPKQQRRKPPPTLEQ